MKLHSAVLRVPTLCAVMACAAMIATAHADALDTTLTQWVKAMDSNGDGAVSREEMMSRGRAAMAQGAQRGSNAQMFMRSFDEMDSNKDGALSAQEISDSINTRFKRADSSNTGQLTLANAKSGMPNIARNFSEIDTAGKGSISLQQVRDFMAAQMQQGIAKLSQLSAAAR